MYCWGGSSEKPYGQKDLSREDLSQGGEVVMRFLRTICVLAIMLIASLPTGLATCEPSWLKAQPWSYRTYRARLLRCMSI